MQLLLLLLSLSTAFADPAAPGEKDPRCQESRVARDAPTEQKTSTGGYRYIGLCSWDGRWKRVEGSAPMKNMLKYLSQRLGRTLDVPSCFRNQDDQMKTLCQNGCKPYGNKDCTGRVADPALAPSQHTIGIAADIQMREYAKNPKALCQILRDMRNTVNGGKGGIANYGGGDGHIDLLPDWCNWGVCEDYYGEGFCQRTKYKVARAKLEGDLLAAKKAASIANVLALQKQLDELNKVPPVPKGGT
jgi:hypothetical protein